MAYKANIAEVHGKNAELAEIAKEELRLRDATLKINSELEQARKETKRLRESISEDLLAMMDFGEEMAAERAKRAKLVGNVSDD